MRLLLLLSVLSVFFSFNASAQNSDIETIKKLNEDWLHSIPKRDSATLSRILADDFIMIAPNGARQNKNDNLLNLFSPNVVVNSVNIDSAEVRLLTPDVGIINAWTSFEMKVDGKTSIGKNCYQDIYVKRNNKWVAVSAHVTILSIR